MKSPITGKEMILLSEPDKIEYRGKSYDIIHHHYLCIDSNVSFTTTELDEINLKELEKSISKNMKVYCCDNNWLDKEPKLTIGKMYEVIEERGHNYFLIENDEGKREVFPRSCFQYIHQMRETKLNNLGI